MENRDVRAVRASDRNLPEDGTSETNGSVEDTHSPRDSSKPQQVSDDTTEGNLINSTNSSESYADRGNAAIRMMLRSCTYFLYDGVSADGGYKEVARVGKAVVELLVDETYPPPRRSDMCFWRKCTEYLVAPAASSLAWFVVRKLSTSRRHSCPVVNAKPASFVWAKALWTVTHRVARQALIYRLFFRIGSVRYSLASLLGIICCFFKETLFPDLLRLRRWPSHFSPVQGLGALFRSVVYAFSFSLPVQNLSKALEDSPRRRGNVKKLIFAVILSQLQSVQDIHKLVSSSQSYTI